MTEADFRVLELFSGVGGMHLALESEKFSLRYTINFNCFVCSRTWSKLQSCGCCGNQRHGQQSISSQFS